MERNPPELPPANARVFTTTCQYCKVQCGYKVYVWKRGTGRRPDESRGESINPTFFAPARKDGEPVYIASVPDESCVINEGNYSVRGGSMGCDVYSPDRKVRFPADALSRDRLTTPMIRRRKPGPLEAVDWQTAISFTASRLAALKQRYGADALGLVAGDWLYGLPTYAIYKLWFSAIRSTSFAGNGWSRNKESAGVEEIYGDGTRSFTVQDFDQTDLLVTAGTNLESTGSVWYYRFLENNFEPGNAAHIVIDPHRNYMAEVAEAGNGIFLQLRPGTDAILAAAWIRRLLEHGDYDTSFVARYTTGFDAVREAVMQPRFTMENAARETEIPPDRLERALDLLVARRGKTMILFEKGIMHQSAGFSHMVAYTVLGTMLGNIGRPGATTSRCGGHPHGAFVIPNEPTVAEGDTVYDRLQAGKIKALWALGTNLFRQVPDQRHYRPLMSETFFIVQDRVHTEMDAAADVIFPAASWGEADGVWASEDRRIRIAHAFADPPGSAKPDWWIAAQVGRAMGYAGFDWKTPTEIWDEQRPFNKDIKDISWDMLEAGGTNGVQYPFVNGRSIERLFSDEYVALKGKRFATDDGKAHLDAIADVAAFDPQAHEWGGVDSQYPLMAFDFRLNELWNSGYSYWNNPANADRTPDAFVVIHPDDARTYRVVSGDWVRITSRYGEMVALARVSRNVPKGTVATPAMFPKAGQVNSHLFPPEPAAKLGDVVTMVAVSVSPT